MLTQELALFEIPESNREKISKINRPTPIHQYKTIENALSSIFPKQEQETRTLKMRKNLSEISKDFSDEQLEVLNTKFQYLIDVWLDVFEKQTFQGKTLKQVLGEK